MHHINFKSQKFDTLGTNKQNVDITRKELYSILIYDIGI